MANHDTSPRDGDHVPKTPSGQRGNQARSMLPHGVVGSPDICELLRNSAVSFGGNDATVAHLLDVNTRNLISGDPRMNLRHGIALYDPLNHFREGDASRLAHGLLTARRHASPQMRDLYTSAIHDMGYRFDERGHIHKVPRHEANFTAAMRNPAFRAHVAVDNYMAAHPGEGRDYDAAGGRPVRAAMSAQDGSRRGVDRGDSRGVIGNDHLTRGVNKWPTMGPPF